MSGKYKLAYIKVNYRRYFKVTIRLSNKESTGNVRFKQAVNRYNVSAYQISNTNTITK